MTVEEVGLSQCRPWVLVFQLASGGKNFGSNKFVQFLVFSVVLVKFSATVSGSASQQLYKNPKTPFGQVDMFTEKYFFLSFF